MASALAWTTIKDQVVAAVGGAYPVVDWEQTADLLQSRAPFIVIEDRGGTEDLISIGAPQAACFEERGFAAIHIFAPIAGGFQVVRQIADDLRERLRMKIIRPAAETVLYLEEADPPTVFSAFEGTHHETEFELGYRLSFHRAIA